MEGENQGMGLKETISTSTLVATTTPNDIDVHLQRNTEYGAAILLGASDYGKQGSDIEARRMDIGSTTFGNDVQASSTGNVYGIYELGYYDMDISNNNKYEWVAACAYYSHFYYVDRMYYDLYQDNENSAKFGDATVETSRWHKSEYTYWIGLNDGFIRGGSGVFSYLDDYNNKVYGRGWDHYARPVVVVGDNF